MAYLAPAQAFDMPPDPTARLVAEQRVAAGSLALPVGPFQDGAMAVRSIEGAVTDRAYRIEAPGQTTLDLLDPLRKALEAQGYATVYACEAAECGGFDFRFRLALIAEPDMHVDLADYRYLAAEKAGAGGPDVVMVVVSRTALAGFVQVTTVGPKGAAAPGTPVPAVADPLAAAVPVPVLPVPDVDAPPLGTGDLDRMFRERGSVVLEDVVFASGASVLEDGAIASLAQLALWLEANPGLRVLVVGHTDASGTLDPNIALGQKRAEAVRQRLIESEGVAGDRITAAGAGFVAPRAGNLTEDGRRRNRRVEIVLLPADG
jgi:outer membrane protein OmpA-like peptidoglycan-associated protein